MNGTLQLVDASIHVNGEITATTARTCDTCGVVLDEACSVPKKTWKSWAS